MDAIVLWSAAVYTAAFLAAKHAFAAIRREHGSRTPKGGFAAMNIVIPIVIERIKDEDRDDDSRSATRFSQTRTEIADL